MVQIPLSSKREIGVKDTKHEEIGDVLSPDSSSSLKQSPGYG